MNATASAVEIAGLSKRYGKTEAVSSLALQAHAGTTFGLVRANGTEKTTLIKCMLAFFFEFDEGHIAIFGAPSCRTDARRRLAFLPESFVPPYCLTGKDFLKYMAGMYERRFDLNECIRMLASIDLDADVLSKPVRALSKGMTQKPGISSCLLSGRDNVGARRTRQCAGPEGPRAVKGCSQICQIIGSNRIPYMALLGGCR
jgi:ABC-2 type transport system ATP-binding protein